MKKIIITTLTFISLSCSGSLIIDSQESVCQNLLSHEKNLCLYTVNDSLFDADAIDVCTSMVSSDYETVQCLKAIKNKEYSSKEIYNCDSILPTEAIRCLMDNGSSL